MFKQEYRNTKYIVEANNVGKKYRTYKSKMDRMKHMLDREGSKYYKDKWVLKGINLKLERGNHWV